MPQNHDPAVLSRISSLIAELDGEEKSARHTLVNGAGVKTAETELGLSGSAKKDPGGYQGASTHPSAKVDSGLQNTPLGARAKENEKDVKEDHPGAGVDNTDAGGGGTQDDKTIESGGLKVRSTGEDPEAEDKYKSDKEDPGTSHPMNAEEIGEKYSSMRFEPLCKMAYDRMNEVIADIANGQPVHAGQQKQANQQPSQTAAQAGYDLAGAVGDEADMEKLAFAHLMTSQVIADAQVDADLVGEYLYKFAAHRQALLKQAEGDPTMMDAAGGMPPGMPPGMDPGAGGGGGMPPGMEGGGMPPGMDPGAGGGEMPPGMDPGAGGGDPGAGGEGGGAGHEEAVNELANALVELGVSPEEIVAAMEAQAGGGGAPGGEGGMPMGPEGEKAGSARHQPIAPQDQQAIYKIASAVYQHQRSGRMRLKEAREGGRTRYERDEVKGYIREVCGIR